MSGQLAAFAVHAFTALGAVLSFQSLLAASAQRWEEAFAWLGIALFVDGVDGPLARRIAVERRLPRFSGERLDLIVDYLTYVLIPAYIIYQAQLMPAGLAETAVAIILMTSLYHFSDSDSKTEDGFFVGFPALWNVVAFYLFVFPLPAPLAFGIVALLGLLTFVPFKWLHPFRARLLRPLTIGVIALWGIAAVAVLLQGFPGSAAWQATIALTTVYFVGVGVARSLR